MSKDRSVPASVAREASGRDLRDLTILPRFQVSGYGPVPVRVSETLTVLPFLFPWAKWGSPSVYCGQPGEPFLVWDISWVFSTISSFSLSGCLALSGAFTSGAGQRVLGVRMWHH